MSGFFIVIPDHECGISNVRIHTFEITSMKKTLDPDTPRDDDLLLYPVRLDSGNTNLPCNRAETPASFYGGRGSKFYMFLYEI